MRLLGIDVTKLRPATLECAGFIVCMQVDQLIGIFDPTNDAVIDYRE